MKGGKMSKLIINVSKSPDNLSEVSTKKTTISKRLYKKLFGDKKGIFIIAPGESVKEILISKEKGDEQNA